MAASLSMVAAKAMAVDLIDGLQAYHEGNYVFALDIFKELSLNGDAAAQFWVGEMYANGQGVQQDLKQAFNWFLRAASLDEPRAQYAVAEAYDLGRGVAQNGKRAASWYLTAAEHGNARAAYAIGLRYAKGIDMPMDLVQAYKWFTQAGDIGAGSKAWVEQKMTPSQLEKARALEQEWLERYQ